MDYMLKDGHINSKFYPPKSKVCKEGDSASSTPNSTLNFSTFTTYLENNAILRYFDNSPKRNRVTDTPNKGENVRRKNDRELTYDHKINKKTNEELNIPLPNIDSPNKINNPIIINNNEKINNTFLNMNVNMSVMNNNPNNYLIGNNNIFNSTNYDSKNINHYNSNNHFIINNNINNNNINNITNTSMNVNFNEDQSNIIDFDPNDNNSYISKNFNSYNNYSYQNENKEFNNINPNFINQNNSYNNQIGSFNSGNIIMFNQNNCYNQFNRGKNINNMNNIYMNNINNNLNQMPHLIRNNNIQQQFIQSNKSSPNSQINMSPNFRSIGKTSFDINDQFKGIKTNKTPLQNYMNLDIIELTKFSYSLAKDQAGCRYLQKKIDEDPDIANTLIYPRILEYIIDLMNDSFGNYLIQKMFDHITEEKFFTIFAIVNKIIIIKID